MKIGRRLGLGFGLILVLMMTMAIVGILRLEAIADKARAIMQEPLAKERMISDWYPNVSGGILRTKAIAKSTEASMEAVFASDAAASAKSSDELRKKIEPLLVTEEEKALYKNIVEQRKRYVEAREKVAKLKAAGKLDEANQLFDATFLPSANAYLGLMRNLVELQRASMDAAGKEIDATAIASRNLMIVLVVLALALGITCSWLLTSGITRPIRLASTAARRVANGDLTGEIVVQRKDETGELLQSLKDMNDSLLKIVKDVRGGTDAIATAAGEIAAGNQDLSARTEHQAGALEETASSMEELTGTVKQNADNARQANEMAEAASGIAAKGGKVVSQVVGTMASINASSRRIVDITSVIDGIAFQTNILALNAAVEAARAGEQGRGFAVVASEVRSLAQRSASAAKEIKSLIDDSVEQVEQGSKLVAEAGATMEEIVASVQRVTGIMAEIADASREQTDGIEQINRAITEMDHTTQQNAALVEQAAAAAQSMQDQTGRLVKAISVFKTGNGPRTEQNEFILLH
jgi:methyl-accepting chemotaxis protein